MNIREATKEDIDKIWPIFHEIVKSGETYAYATDTTKAQALMIWIEAPRKTYVLEENGKIVGTYYLKTNHGGPAQYFFQGVGNTIDMRLFHILC